MKKRLPHSPDGFVRLLPLFLLIGLLPLLSHWLRASLPSFLDPLPSPPTCSTSGGCSAGECFKFIVETDCVAALASKCGYPEFTNPPTLPPSNLSVLTNIVDGVTNYFYVVNGPPKFYLEKKTAEARHNHPGYANAGWGVGWFCGGWSAGEQEWPSGGTYNATFTWDPATCSELSASHGGTVTWTSVEKMLGGFHNCFPGGSFTSFTNLQATTQTSYLITTTITNAATGQWNDYLGSSGSPFTYWPIIAPPGTRTLTHTSDVATYVTNWTEGEKSTPYPPNPLGYDESTYNSNGYPTYTWYTNAYADTNHYTLTNEYTDTVLTNTVLGKLGPFQTNWQESGCLKAWVKKEPYTATGGTNDNGSAGDPESASAHKFRARVRFMSKFGVTYNVTWTVTDSSGGPPQAMPVIGTGDEMTVDLGDFIPSVANPDITLSDVDVAEDLGSTPGSGTPTVASLGLKLGLGHAGPKRSAGHLRLHEALPSAALATPAKLTFTGLTNLTEIIRDTNDWVRQARAPQTLADIVTLSTNAYEVRFYTAANSGVLTNGLYVPTGSPFVVWGVSGFATNTNLFRITETRGASTTTNDFEWAATNQSWTLTSGNGLRREIRSEVWSNTNTLQTITRSILRPSDNALIAQSVEVNQKFADGTKPISRSIGDGAATRTTTYTYYPDSEGHDRAPLKTVVNPDGSWQWHEYDANKRLVRTYAAFGNQSPTNAAALCRVTEYDYTPVGTDDDGSVQSWEPRTTVEKLLSTEVGRTYAVYRSHETLTIRCQTAGAAWDAADNLVTTTRTCPDGNFKGWPKSERRPDGTLTLHEYEVDGAGNLSTLVWSGQPNGAGDILVAGSKLVTLQGPLGNVIERTTVDIASDIITGSETFSDFDEFGRPGRVTYLDDTFKLFTYLCCGLESETDRDGVTTLYSYDALKRRIASTRNGISHINTLDAAGQTLFTHRQGTNGSTVTLRSAVFDTAGRLLFDTNAVGNVTSYQYTQTPDPITQTQTLPNGSTRIETYFREGTLASVTGTAVHGVRYGYGIESDLAYVKEIKLKDDGSDSGEWTKTFRDMMGRPFKTVFPDSAYVQSWFNNQGQLWKQRDADGVVTLRQYNGLAELEYEALDMDRNDTIDFAGTDRITRTVRRVGTAASLSSVNAFIAEKWVFTTDGATNTVLAVLSESAVDGTARAQTTFGLTNRSYHACGGTCASTNFAPDGSYAVTLKTDGYLTSVTRYDAANAQLGATAYTYDEHGLQKTITDARNGTTTLIRDDLGRVTSATTPTPGGGQSAQTTTTYYDDGGNVWRVVKPDGTSVTNEFYLTREFKKKYGSQTYPEERTWDYAGRPKTLKTWQDFAGNTGTATTTWNYSTNRGFLLSKQYQDGNGPSYTWTAGGKLETRTWARGVVTSNAFNNAMDLVAVDYSDSTPDVAFTYDRRGRLTSASASTYAATNYLTDASQLLSELWTAGPLSGLAVTNSYDAYLRRTNLTLQPSNLSTRYSYDSASRLASVGDGTNTTTYAYLANSALIEHLAFLQNSTTRMTTTNRYDYLNRLTGVSSVPSADSTVSFDYAYNDANQRVAVTNADSSRWSWGYDSLGQVKSGKRYWSDSTIVAGQQFEYAFDSIGNRTSASFGGSQFGTSLRTATYAANLLNQYTNRSVPGYVEVQGSANSNATVTVNNESTYRKGSYYRKELSVANSSAAVWQGITNIAVLNNGGTNGEDIVTTKTGNVLVPKTPEVSTYDADGNLTQDGEWTYTWDAENRLVSKTSLTNLPSASRQKLDFAYDNKWRRIQKTVSTWDGSAYVPQSTNRFLYDGWNLVALLDGNGSLLQSFRWGIDLSGSLQRAGGVGGLKGITVHTGTNAGSHFFAYDGNGNVMALVNAATGIKAAEYEYGPFGESLRANGPLALLNPFRFSTKFCDDESGFYYYGYRYYDPSTGRWPNRDPKGENGGNNLLGFVRNAPLGHVDALGLDVYFDWDKFKNDWCPFRCNGKPYNPLSQCCCDGKLYNKAPVPTGIRLCTAPVHGMGWVDHVWLEVDDKAIDSASSGSFNGPANISNASDYVGDPKKSCFDLNLSECDYDIVEYKKSLKALIDSILSSLNPDGTSNTYNYCPVGANCGNFAEAIAHAPESTTKRKCNLF